ncbi:MAG: glycosyltransferase family 39 protein [Candidatus Brocadia sp.]|nr:glycosyltransferase family 39 protein [Candidatus Brocadia sp.]
MPKILTEKRLLIFILFIAFFVRFTSLIVFMYKNNITVHESGMTAYPQNDDSQLYYHTAVNLASGKGYSISVTDQNQKLPPSFKLSNIPNTYYHNFYPPSYSLFLSILYRFFGTSVLVYAIPQIILGTISCYLTYIIARESFSSKVGLFASFLLAIYPPIVWWTSYIRSENLFIPLLLLTIIFLIKAVKNKLDTKNTILSGVFLAVSFLCRNVILYLPLFIIFYFFIVFFGTNNKRLLYGVTIFLVSFYISLLPWVYRNYTLYNQFAITTTEDWDTFYICNVISADLPFFDLHEVKYEQDTEDDIKLLMLAKGTKEASIVFIKKHPLKYLKLCTKRFLAYWGPVTKKPSFPKKVVDTFIYIIVFPMAFYGFYKSKCWTNPVSGLKPAPTLLITVILYYTLLHSAVGVDDALIYRYPIIPLICIFSAYGYFAYFTRS